MTYCSLEEAWGSDFSSSKYFEKINQQPQQQQQPLIQQSTVPPNPPENMRTYPKVNNQETSDLDKYFPSYNGGNPIKNTIKSNIVPYQVSFPDKAKRNYTYPVEVNDDDDNDSALDLLEDNSNDIKYIDRQRNIKSSEDYMTSEDYFLYKKYLNLAEKYKQKLKSRYRNFVENEEPQLQRRNIQENFGNMSSTGSGIYSMKEVFIIIIIGIFIILALDIFVKMGERMKK
jgi:hypothetical protein